VGYFPYGNDTAFFTLLTTIVETEPPKLPNTFCPEFCDLITKCLQKLDSNRPESSALLSHPWITKYENDGVNIKEWLESVYTKK